MEINKQSETELLTAIEVSDSKPGQPVERCCPWCREGIINQLGYCNTCTYPRCTDSYPIEQLGE